MNPNDTRETTRFDRYDLLEKVGEGGFGSVYKARHRFLEHIYALKVLPPTLRSDEEAMARFEREVRALRSLDHENVVRVHDAGIETNSGAPYIAMSFVEGQTLRDRLLREGPLPVEEVVRLGRQMADALHHLHTHDPDHALVHRDVKPSNIIVTPDNRAVLTDFGIAFSAALPRISRESIGTPEFMSPEQTEGEALDGRSDLYSLGMVMYELLTGRLPFEEESDTMASMARLLDRILHEKVPPPSAFRSDVPKWLDSVISRCLEKRPDDRYPNCAVLAEALRTGNPDPDVSNALAQPAAVAASDANEPMSEIPAGRATRRSPRASTIAATRPDLPPESRVSAAPPSLLPKRAMLLLIIAALLLIGGWLAFGNSSTSFLRKPAVSAANQEQIDALLTEAEAAIAEDELTTPEGESALDKAQAVLAIDEENDDAQQLLSQISSQYEDWGDKAFDEGDYYEALNYYERGLRADSTESLKQKRSQVEAELVVLETEQRTSSPNDGNASQGNNSQGKSSGKSKRERLGW